MSWNAGYIAVSPTRLCVLRVFSFGLRPAGALAVRHAVNPPSGSASVMHLELFRENLLECAIEIIPPSEPFTLSILDVL